MIQSDSARLTPARPQKSCATLILYWTTGLVVLIESCLFVFSASRGRSFEHSGLPHFIRPLLGGAEIVAAVLFLIPPARGIGGRTLLVIFAIAALIHLLHGQWDVDGLLLYGAAVYAVLDAYKS